MKTRVRFGVSHHLSEPRFSGVGALWLGQLFSKGWAGTWWDQRGSAEGKRERKGSRGERAGLSQLQVYK